MRAGGVWWAFFGWLGGSSVVGLVVEGLGGCGGRVFGLVGGVGWGGGWQRVWEGVGVVGGGGGHLLVGGGVRLLLVL